MNTSEENNMSIFKGYLRNLKRQLDKLKDAINENDIPKAKLLINELLDDTQKNIEE